MGNILNEFRVRRSFVTNMNYKESSSLSERRIGKSSDRLQV